MKVLFLAIATCIATCNGNSLGQSIRGQLENKVAVCFSGGGFRAHAVHTAMVAGLAAQMKETSGENALQKLFQKVDAFGSNSGGSWFSSQLLFSKNFNKMLLDIGTAGASGIEAAEAIYQKRWIDPFLYNFEEKKINAKEEPDSALVQVEEGQLVEGTLWDAIKAIFKFLQSALTFLQEWSLVILHKVFETSASWTEMIHHLIQVPGDIDASAPLNNKNVNQWAKGKEWAVAGALVAPWGKEKAYGHFWTDCTLPPQASSPMNIPGQPSGNQETTPFTPGSVMYTLSRKLPYGERPSTWPLTFSTVLGNPTKPAPLSFIPGWEDIFVKYSSVSLPLFNGFIYRTMDESTVEGPVFSDSPLLQHSEKVSLADAVSTSSSFLGRVVSLITLLPDVVTKSTLATTAFKKFFLNLATYISVSEKDPFKAFATGTKLAREVAHMSSCDSMLKQTVAGRVLTLADGGYVDNAAIAQLAQQSDRTEFVLFQNNGPVGYSDVEGLFQPSEPFTEAWNEVSRIPIFKEKDTWAVKQMKQFPKLVLPKGVKHLGDIQYGTLQATIVKQPLFGITKERQVTVHCLFVHSDVGIGETAWTIYPKIVGEISAALSLPENKKAISTILSWMN